MSVTPPEPAEDAKRAPVGYGRIRRGPMAADQFTQIRNTLFRDNRLSFRDKGVFGLISTHRDGFGVSAESIAACSPTDGVSAVKTSLRNLEKYGYLRRTRERRTDGTLGGAVYFITDDPSMFIGPGEQMTLEMPSSQPTVPQPTLAEPTLAEPAEAQPTVVQSTHKNTKSKNTSGKKTLSPRALDGGAPSPPVPGAERETGAAPNDKPLTAAQEAIRALAAVAEADEPAFIAWVRNTHPPAGPSFWRTVRDNGDLLEIAETWRASRPGQQRASPAPPARPLLPWCEDLDCDEETRWRREVDAQGFTRTGPCADCHPDHQKDAA